jgi:hypothetical protein
MLKVIPVLKRNTKKKEKKTVEVELNIPKVSITSLSMMSIVLALTVSLISYSGYLGVKSIWNFTHPKFNISLDTFKVLGYIASGNPVPPIAFPSFPDGKGPTDLAKSEFLNAASAFKTEFRDKFPNSRLAQLPDNVLLGIAWSFCQAKDSAISKEGKFDAQEIINEHQAKLLFRYPFIAGLNEFVDGIGKKSLETLCKGN